jgi:ElaB/YqjD/DUF883 family membrane-anchored ribosome-binding protein
MPMPKNPPMPTEFAQFLQDLGIRSFDHLSERLTKKETSTPRGIHGLAARWTSLSRAEKEKFFKLVISAGEAIIAAAPAVVAGAAAMRKSKSTRAKAADAMDQAKKKVENAGAEAKTRAKKITKKVAKKIMNNI